MLNKEYELLLNENYTDEVYELILADYIDLFKCIINENVEKINQEDTENVFVYLFWKVFKYSKNFNDELIKLRELIIELKLQNDNMKSILYEIETLFFKIKEKSGIKEEINISECLKRLCNDCKYELVIEIIQNLYYYPQFLKILNQKNITYKKYDSFSNIAQILENNCREYRSIVQTIKGYYPYEITLKERVDDLLDLTEAFNDI